MSEIGDRLKRLRLAAGLSQRTLSFPGCTPAYICRIELGDREPSVRVLAQRLGVSTDYLETGQDRRTFVVVRTPDHAIVELIGPATTRDAEKLVARIIDAGCPAEFVEAADATSLEAAERGGVE